MGSSKKPAAKVELGERRILFCDGVHGEMEIENEEIICSRWDVENWRFEMKKMKNKKRLKLKAMIDQIWL